MSNFEKAARLKLRFNVNGNNTVEDLWDFTKEQLADYEVKLQESIEKQGKTNRFVKKNGKLAIEELKLQIVSHIIDTKITEEEESANSTAKKAKREEILSLIAEKQRDSRAKKSIEELEKELEDLN